MWHNIFSQRSKFGFLLLILLENSGITDNPNQEPIKDHLNSICSGSFSD